MAKSQQKKARVESEGVAVRTDQPRNARYEDGVPVRTPDVPEQTAGSEKAGRSADNQKEKD